jgi:hypothetical protein
VRTCQDMGIVILGGLMHKNPVVRHCTQVTIEHDQNDENWMLTEHGDDTPRLRIDTLRYIAGLSLHAGNGTAPEATSPGTTKHDVVCLSYQLSPTCKALLGGVWGNQWVLTTNQRGIAQGRTDTQAITQRITMSDNTLCVDMTDLQAVRRSGVIVRGVTCAERVPCAVRATVAPAARCCSMCCVLPYWMPLVDAVLNVVV